MAKAYHRYGTSHFVTLGDAISYYAEYGISRSNVHHKLSAGEIHIGAPELKPGQKLTIIDNGRRYAIEENSI